MPTQLSRSVLLVVMLLGFAGGCSAGGGPASPPSSPGVITSTSSDPSLSTVDQIMNSSRTPTIDTSHAPLCTDDPSCRSTSSVAPPTTKVVIDTKAIGASCPSSGAMSSILGETVSRTDTEGGTAYVYACDYGSISDSTKRAVTIAVISDAGHSTFSANLQGIKDLVAASGGALEPAPEFGDYAWRKSNSRDSSHTNAACSLLVGSTDGSALVTVGVKGNERDSQSSLCTIAKQLMNPFMKS